MGIESKPSIYNTTTVYKQGGAGGGGNKGTIFEVDFKNYPESIFSVPYLYPNIGTPIYWGKGNVKNIELIATGLRIGKNNGYNQSNSLIANVNLFGFTGKKIKFYQKVIGVGSQGSGGGANVGLCCQGITNTNSSSRGMLLNIQSGLLSEGNLLNGHKIVWYETVDSTPYTNSYIAPPDLLYPINDKILESNIIFDFENKKITYELNGVEAFESNQLNDELFYMQLNQVKKFCIVCGGNDVILEKIKVESFD